MSMMAKPGPSRVAKGQGWAAGKEWKEERGALYLGQLCDASKWAFPLAWQQVLACAIYGEGSPVSHGHIH